MHFNLIWVFLEKFGTSLLSVGVFFIYAYLLEPEEMGVAIIILSVTQFLSILISTLFEDAMVQVDKISTNHISTAFYASITLSVVAMMLTMCGFMYFPSGLVGYSVVALVGVASFEILLTNIGVVYVAQLRRDGGFKVLALRVLIGRIGGSLLGLVAIFYGLGAWAIILQSVVGSALQVIILITSVRKIPKFSFDTAIFKYYLSFGSLLSLNRLKWDIMVRATPIIAGVTLGTASAGHLGFAWRIVELFRSAIVSGITNYLLPHFSRMQNDKECMAKEFVSSTSIIAFFVTPIFLGIMVTAPLIIATIFEEKWYATIPLIQLYCVSALVGSYRVAASVSIIASGFPGKMLIEGLVVTVVSLFLMSAIGHIGLWMFGFIFIINATILLPIGMGIINDLLGLNWKQQLSPVARYAVPGFAMAGVLMMSQIIYPRHPVIDTLLFQVSMGVAVFMLIAFIFYKKEIVHWKSNLITKKNN